MAEPKAKVHFQTRRRYEPTDVWKTACGLKLDKAARAGVTLTEDREHTTCKKCKETFSE